MHQDTKSPPSDSRQKRRRRRPARNSKKNNEQEAPSVLAKTSTLDKTSAEATDAQRPLSSEEVAEMKSHLRFLFKNRKRLQLKINANEDLLLNGSREPSERGVCMHLLGKVDRACIEHAISRIPAPQDRTDLLAGIVRFSSDVGVLVLYLESLKDTTSRQEAATALSMGLQRIDFNKATKSQTTSVLELILALFPEKDLPQLLFGLLQSDSFRNAFDNSSDRLPPPLGDIFVPLREVFAVVALDQTTEYHALFKRGLNLILDSATYSLAGYPTTMRARFFEYALELSEKPSETDATLQRILESFPPKSRQYSDLGMLWVRSLLKRHNDSKATGILNQLKQHHPGFNLPGAWLTALKQERIGRVAITEGEAKKNHRCGLWLDEQRPVVVQLLEPGETTGVHPQVEIHKSLTAPGVAPFIVAGETPEGAPYLAVLDMGRCAALCYQRRPPREIVVSHVREGITLLWMLGTLGIGLPDLELNRFVVDKASRLWLEDLRGSRRQRVLDALAQNLSTAKEWLDVHLHHLQTRRPHALCREKIQEAPTFNELFLLTGQLP